MSSPAKRLIQFDVDSTFIEQEVIELLAAKAGVLAQVRTITNLAMNGGLDFEASLKTRVALLAGLSVDVIAQVQQEIRLTDGAQQLVSSLHAMGHEVSLVSGGFRQIMAPLVAKLGVKFFRANTLAVADGYLTGELTGPIIDSAAKATALREFAAIAGVDMVNTVAIGDGANDLDMMAAAGVSIAFMAKPVVVEAADLAITVPTLTGVLKLLGLA